MHLQNFNVFLIFLILVIQPIKCYEPRDNFDISPASEANYHIPIGNLKTFY